MSEVLVLAYHSVSPSWPAVTNVTPERLDEQLTFLVEEGWSGLTLRDALTAPVAKSLVVTFDDAHASVLDNAYPILTRLGLPGTVFVPTDFASTGQLMGWPGYASWLGGAHEHELRCMSWPQLVELDSEGWEIGSHTRSHPRLTELDDESLARELGESRAECEDRLGRDCPSFAYPYSDHDARVARAAAQAGYRFAVTIPQKFVPPLPLQWPRVGVYHYDTPTRFRLRLMRRSGKLRALGAVSDGARKVANRRAAWTAGSRRRGGGR